MLGLAGTHEEAETITTLLRNFIRDELQLDLTEEQTRITHARTEQARFLGYAVSITAKDRHRTAGHRSVNGKVTLEIPEDVIRQQCARYMANGAPIHQPGLLNNAAFSIVAQYQAEYRGLVNDYRPAHNRRKLGILKWTMERALTKTLAYKFKVSVSAVYRRLHTTVRNDNGKTYKARQVVIERTGKKPLTATWGGISLARQMTRQLSDTPYRVWNDRNELVQRLQKAECERCGSAERTNAHHIRKLADLQKHGRTPPRWAVVMAARQRKTVILCHTCHRDLHAGRLDTWVKEHPGAPCDAKVSSTVRRGADGKVPA